MTIQTSTIMSMAKTEKIDFRVSPAIKHAITTAAKRNGRSVANYLIWLAAQNDGQVREALLND